MSRRIHRWVGLVAVAGLVGACTVGKELEKTLEGEPCTVPEDCWHTQECARTEDEELLGLPGTCRPEGTGCIVGAQLGCSCSPVDTSINCSAFPLPVELYDTYPRMVCDPALLLCTEAPPAEGDPP